MSSKILQIAMAGCVVTGVFACGSTSGTGGSDAGDASTESGGEASVDGALGGEGGSDAAPDGGECSPAPVGRLCVRGEPTSGGEALTAGGTVTFQVFPKGCFSSSCTEKVQTSCAAMPSGTAFDVTGTFCLRGNSGGGACTADCNGGGFANCAQMGVAAGSYEARLGSLKVSFTVPSTLAFGGSCEGSQF